MSRLFLKTCDTGYRVRKGRSSEWRVHNPSKAFRETRPGRKPHRLSLRASQAGHLRIRLEQSQWGRDPRARVTPRRLSERERRPRRRHAPPWPLVRRCGKARRSAAMLTAQTRRAPRGRPGRALIDHTRCVRITSWRCRPRSRQPASSSTGRGRGRAASPSRGHCRSARAA